jgi:hypothetical protein
MQQRKIVIEISPIGETKIDAHGFAGNSCSTATRDIELVLAGGGPVDDRKKPEYYAKTGAYNPVKG